MGERGASLVEDRRLRRFRWCWSLSFILASCLPLQAQQRSPAGTILRAVGEQGWRAVQLARLQEQNPWLGGQPVYQGLWQRIGGASDSSVFDFLPFVSAPRQRDGTALAYDQGAGARLWSGFTETAPGRSALLGVAARGMLELWRLLPPVGGGPRDLLGPRPCPAMRVRLGMEALSGFGTNGRDLPSDAHALTAYAECGRDLGRAWQVAGGLRAYAWRSPGAEDLHDLEASVRLTRAPPGDEVHVFLDASWTTRYRRGILHVERPVSLAAWRVRPFVRLAWGDGLPFPLGFWPGGYDGFPGLHSGEARGDREVTLALDVMRPLVGKLSARAMLAAGRTRDGGSLLGQPWLVGARAGLNLDTRLGLVRLEYGLATESHRAFFIRIGHIL
ncbi:MAG: hypothetical protein ACJ8DJ_10825 [Gemmatimonadales bacterium]